MTITYTTFVVTAILIVVLYNIYLLFDLSSLLKEKQQYKLNLLHKKEGFDLPILMVTINNKPYFFIVDTACYKCLLDETTCSTILSDNPSLKFTDGASSISGIGGNVAAKAKYITLDFSYNNLNFSQDFITSELSGPFQSTSQYLGTNCAGLLGISFFNKYKAKLDFKRDIILISKDDLHNIKST